MSCCVMSFHVISCHFMSWPLVLSLVLSFVLSLFLSFVLSCALLFAKVESKQDVLASSKRELEEERQLLERGKKEAATEAENLDRRREVCYVACTKKYYVALVSTHSLLVNNMSVMGHSAS